MPSTSQLALDLMCGEWGASRCSAQKWFHYLGSPEENSFVPFEINYISAPNTKPINGMIPQDPRVVPCYEAVDVSNVIFIFFFF